MNISGINFNPNESNISFDVPEKENNKSENLGSKYFPKGDDKKDESYINSTQVTGIQESAILDHHEERANFNDVFSSIVIERKSPLEIVNPRPIEEEQSIKEKSLSSRKNSADDIFGNLHDPLIDPSDKSVDDIQPPAVSSTKKIGLKYRIFEALATALGINPESWTGFWANIGKIFTSTPLFAYVAVFALSFVAGMLMFNILPLASLLIVISAPTAILPIFLFANRLITNIAVGCMKRMTDHTLEGVKWPSFLFSMSIWIIASAIAMPLNTLKGILTFNQNDFKTARTDGSQYLPREQILLKIQELIVGVAILATYLAIGYMAYMALTLSGGSALLFMINAAQLSNSSFFLSQIMYQASMWMIQSQLALHTLLSISIVATIIPTLKIAYDLYINFFKEFIRLLLRSYATSSHNKGIGANSIKKTDHTNTTPPLHGHFTKELFVPILNFLKDQNPNWDALDEEEKKTRILKETIASQYILDEYHTLLELYKLIMKYRTLGATTIKEILKRINSDFNRLSDKNMLLLLQKLCPSPEDQLKISTLNQIETNLKFSLGLLLPFISQDSELSTADYLKESHRLANTAEIYSYIQMPSAQKEYLNVLLKKIFPAVDEYAIFGAVVVQQIKNEQPRELLLRERRERHIKKRSLEYNIKLLNREEELEYIFSDAPVTVNFESICASIASKIASYFLEYDKEQLLQALNGNDDDNLYDSKLHSSGELTNAKSSINSSDKIILNPDILTQELVRFIDKEYKNTSIKFQNLYQTLINTEGLILRTEQELKFLANFNYNYKKTIELQKIIDLQEQEFVALSQQMSICAKIIDYDKQLLQHYATNPTTSPTTSFKDIMQSSDIDKYRAKNIKINPHLLIPNINDINPISTEIIKHININIDIPQNCNDFNGRAKNIKEMLIEFSIIQNRIEQVSSYLKNHKVETLQDAQILANRYRRLLPSSKSLINFILQLELQTKHENIANLIETILQIDIESFKKIGHDEPEKLSELYKNIYNQALDRNKLHELVNILDGAKKVTSIEVKEKINPILEEISHLIEKIDFRKNENIDIGKEYDDYMFCSSYIINNDPQLEQVLRINSFDKAFDKASYVIKSQALDEEDKQELDKVKNLIEKGVSDNSPSVFADATRYKNIALSKFLHKKTNPLIEVIDTLQNGLKTRLMTDDLLWLNEDNINPISHQLQLVDATNSQALTKVLQKDLKNIMAITDRIIKILEHESQRQYVY